MIPLKRFLHSTIPIVFLLISCIKVKNKFSNNFNIDELFRIEYHYKLKLTFYLN